jgi:hypothetical protein
MISNDKYYIFNSKNLKFIKYDPITRILTDELLIDNFFESANRSVYTHSDTDKMEVNEEIDHFNTGADKFIEKGFGKLYIMR